MNHFIRYIKGYVRINLFCVQPQRFFDMCAHNHIILYHITFENGSYSLEISIKDFRRLQPISRKCKAHIHIIEKNGLPFFFYRNRKRKAFFVGIIVAGIILLGLSTRIWNIHVEGNYSYSTGAIIDYLKDNMIHHGMAKNEVDCSNLAANMREHFPGIVWVTAKVKGTRLLIMMKESTETAETVDDTKPCDLVADSDGTIVKMITREGVPQLRVGDNCRKGDVLVSGELEILNDSQEIIRYDYVHADADVYVQKTYSYYDEFPIDYMERKYTGKTKNQYFFQAFSCRAYISTAFGKYEQYDCLSTEANLHLTENFYLPFSVGKIESREYITERKTYSRGEAIELETEKLNNFVEELSEKGMKIFGNDVKIKVSEGSCTGEGSIYVIEKIGEPQPVSKKEIPEERTQVDE